MMQDARFEDGDEKPLRLVAQDEEGLQILSALLQDAVLHSGDIAWLRKKHRVTLLINRFRWEDADAARAAGREMERVRSLLTIENALSLQATGIRPSASDMVLSLLACQYEESEKGGMIMLTLSGDGALRAKIEALDISLTDVTRPYRAVSGKMPQHRDA